MNRLRKFAGLSPAARGVFLYSLVLIAVMALGIRVCAVARCARFLACLERLTQRVRGGLSPRETTRLVVAAGSAVRACCLPRSLVLGHMLKAAGASVDVRLGVSVSAAGDFSAHAWVELDGVPVADEPDLLDRYTPFPPTAIGLGRARQSRPADRINRLVPRVCRSGDREDRCP